MVFVLPRPKPISYTHRWTSLKFTKPGVYEVYCLIHQPEMVQTITVQAAGTPYPQTQSTISAQAQAGIAADLALGQQSVLLFPYPKGGPHLVAGISPGLASGTPSTATVMRFLIGDTLSSTAATVPVGTTVVWTNQSNNEPHTVTFAPVGQPFPTIDPFSPPSGGSTYDGSTLVNSGVLGLGQSFSLTF
jgi:plastocyanin